MNLGARSLLLLAQPRSNDDRDRRALLVGSVALAGGLLVAAGRLVRLPGPGAGDLTGFAPYVAQAGLRPGVVIGAILLAVPLLALAVQAVNVGVAAKRRRTALLQLSGATPGQARAVSATDAAVSAAVGGLLAGPVYLVLWLALGVLPSPDHRLLPDPTPLDLVVWLAVALGLTAGAILADLWSMRTRARRIRRSRIVASLVAAIAAVLVLTRSDASSSSQGAILAMCAAIALFAVAAFAIGPWLVSISARVQGRRQGAARMLASSRVLAEVNGPGRVAGVLLLCGIAVGIEAGVALHSRDTADAAFYQGGAALAGACTAVAVLLAMLSLVISVAEQMIDGSRPWAVMHALGVDPATSRKAQRLALSTATLPAATIGVILGALLMAPMSGVASATGLCFVALLALASASVLHGIGALAVLALSRRRTAARDVDHLRVA